MDPVLIVLGILVVLAFAVVALKARRLAKEAARPLLAEVAYYLDGQEIGRWELPLLSGAPSPTDTAKLMLRGMTITSTPTWETLHDHVTRFDMEVQSGDRRHALTITMRPKKAGHA